MDIESREMKHSVNIIDVSKTKNQHQLKKQKVEARPNL